MRDLCSRRRAAAKYLMPDPAAEMAVARTAAGDRYENQNSRPGPSGSEVVSRDAAHRSRLFCLLNQLLDVDTALYGPEQAPNDAKFRLRRRHGSLDEAIVVDRNLHQLVAGL
jgi:hypothetical protein